jgi:pyruvate/2-oxoglutarate dehydrogenase complex dihydrolipoamide dehydrogenase (E3) component
MPFERYEAIIIGAGQAGVPLAGALARSGRRTLLVERAEVGGSCINYGCTPTKTLVASARAAFQARRAAEFGIRAGEVRVDMPAVRQRKQRVVAQFRGGIERRLEGAEGLTLIRGEARFTGPRRIEIHRPPIERLEAEGELVFINTGARPIFPQVPGLTEVPALDSTSIMELDEVPAHLLVLGAGYVGLEFAQLFRRLGSQVTVIQRSGQVLSHEDADVAEALTAILREDGLTVWLNTDTREARPGPGGQVSLRICPRGGDEDWITGSHLLVAAGRRPNTENLNLAAAGVQVDGRGAIPVNERLESNVPGIYALGDVNGGPAFTHIAYDDYRVICANVLGGPARTAQRQVPYVVYTDPQLGRVGMTEAQARQAGHDIRVGRMPINYIARATEIGETRGLAKAIVDAADGQILGAAILGPEGGELMAMIQVAMLGRVPYWVLRDAVFAHPSLAEGLNTLFSQVDGE